MRRLLTDLESEVKSQGAWISDLPLWWQPLPAEIELELLWRELGGNRRIDDTPQTISREIPWCLLPEVLTATWCAALHADLEIALAAGDLGLDRGTIGSSDQVSARRTDEVLYLSGREPDLLRAMPRLAATVQWSLHRLSRGAGGRFPWLAAHPPGRAMLARYPAPSTGFGPHLDNPGGDHDNHRLLSVVLYLNPPESACLGGELALWRPGDGPPSEPAALLPPSGGSAIAFAARSVGHEVLPLRPGPARWSLAIWLNAEPLDDAGDPHLPALSATDVLLPIASPPLPEDKLLLHILGESDSGSQISIHDRSRRTPRAGIICTAYGAGDELISWCRHHLDIGFEHLVLVLDGPDEPAEQDLARRLRETWGDDHLTLWTSAEVLERAGARRFRDFDDQLLAFAYGGRGAQAVSARQTLNATAALAAARAGELPGSGIEWLVHLDADERFHLQGPARGGATVAEHFAALEDSGVARARYLNHELLRPGPVAGETWFKLNPRLASTRLGTRGWVLFRDELAMGPADPRPYFHGYGNGKSAVDVRFGTSAAGVHGWRIDDHGERASVTLAGPSVLHHHYASVESFVRRYMALGADSDHPPGVLFEPYSADARAVALARSLFQAGASEERIRAELEKLHRTLTEFADPDVELLEAAGLLMKVQSTSAAA